MSNSLTKNQQKVTIGEPVLTRYERARIVGARALQISHGAPVLIDTDNDDFRPHDVANKELKARVLPIGLARRLPNGDSQVIPIHWLKDREFIAQIDMEIDTSLSRQSSDDLTRISGIGEGSIDAFYDAGFNTIASIANADVSDLTKISGIGKKTATDIISAAKEVQGGASVGDKEDLTIITGIGEGTVDSFYDAGFTTVSSIANASVEDLTKISGIGKKTATDLINAAKEIV